MKQPRFLANLTLILFILAAILLVLANNSLAISKIGGGNIYGDRGGVGPVPPCTATLTITKSGTGIGTVQSTDGYIDCGSTCTYTYACGTSVTLNASPGACSTFVGWTGDGTGNVTRIVTMDADKTVNAQFDLTTYVLTVTKSGTGTGTVTSSDGFINCGATCSHVYACDSTTTLTATPDAGSVFVGWSGGGCTGTGTCTVTMDTGRTVDAQFDLVITTYVLTVTKSGTGTGTVTSGDGFIDCGATCSHIYNSGNIAILTATPSTYNSFVGWSGDGTGDITRTVIMDADKNVDAEFSNIPKGDYLIAWYKFDEGSGTVVYNQATDGSLGEGLLPDLNVVGLNAFWSGEPGFGKKSESLTQDFAWNNTNRTLLAGRGKAFGAFIKMNTALTPLGGCASKTGQFITSEIAGGGNLILAPYDDGFGNPVAVRHVGGQGTGTSFIWSANPYGNWLFHFVASDDGKYRVVLPNGTILIGEEGYPDPDYSGQMNISYILIGFQWADDNPPTIIRQPNPAAFGDWILYYNTTLTLAEWAAWYDLLRERYGMAARSGW